MDRRNPTLAAFLGILAIALVSLAGVGVYVNRHSSITWTRPSGVAIRPT